MPRTSDVARPGERGFTIVEVMVAIVVTSIAAFGIAAAVLGALRAQAAADAKLALDDDVLAVLADVRTMTVYDGRMLANLPGRSATMTRTLASGQIETIVITVELPPATPAAINALAPLPLAFASATATAGGLSASERIALYQEAPSPGSVVEQ